MKRKGFSVRTKDGYIITKHTIALYKDKFYSIERYDISKICGTYKEVFDTLTVLRTFI